MKERKAISEENSNRIAENKCRNELTDLKLSDPVLFSVVLICRFDKHERKKSPIRGTSKYNS